MRVLIVDLDDTLIKTSEFKEDLFKELALRCKVEEEVVRKIYQEIRGRSPLSDWFELLPEELALQYKLDPQGIQKIIIENIPKIKIMQDTLNFVKKFNGKKIVLSFGNEKFQMLKIKGLKLDQYFDEIHITNGWKIDFLPSLVKESDEVLFIDNNQEVLDDVKQNFSWIKVISPESVHSILLES